MLVDRCSLNPRALRVGSSPRSRRGGGTIRCGPSVGIAHIGERKGCIVQLSSPELAIPLIRMIRQVQAEPADAVPASIRQLADALESAKQRRRPATVPAPTAVVASAAPAAPAQFEPARPLVSPTLLGYAEAALHTDRSGRAGRGARRNARRPSALSSR